jgi:hypothetical protein
VVKPNSSDVTDTKPADAPPDISDSMAGNEIIKLNLYIGFIFMQQMVLA